MFNVEKWMEIAEKYGAKFKNITFIRDENDFVGAYAIDLTDEAYVGAFSSAPVCGKYYCRK